MKGWVLNMDAGNQTLLKRNNQRAILEDVIKNGPLSRAGLAKRLKISKPTVSANVGELLERRLLLEIGYTSAYVGKRPMLLDINANARYVLALDFISELFRHRIGIAVCNLRCEPVITGTIELPECFGKKDIQALLPERLLAQMKSSGIPVGDIGCLVLTAPNVEYSPETVRFECPNGDTINLAELFSPYFAGKIAVQNDINLAALGEKYFGIGKPADTLLFAWIGLTVGGGLILDGSLYEGKNNLGGELSYCTIYSDVLGQYRRLRDITSLAGIREYITARKNEAATSKISGRLLDGTFTLDMMIGAALAGDDFCNKFASYIGQTVAPVLANTAHTLNLEMLIVGGDYSYFGSVFLDEISSRISDIPLSPAVVATPRHSNAALYGAFQFGTQNVIRSLI